MTTLNLLDEALLRTRLISGDVVQQSLPEVYTAMAKDQISGFPALRPHQRHAWHAFLAQLAVISMHRAGCAEPPTASKEWAELLRGLTRDYPRDEPWCLLVEDSTQPAFMQCPSPRGLEEYRKSASAPDDLDILVTAKNHDVKKTTAIHCAYEDWIFALVNLQTMAGFLGRGNYGIARMNGGFSARPCLGLAPADGRVGAHLFFDVKRMITARDEILQNYRYYQSIGGQALLWLMPWDGESSSPLTGLDPYFIEICRRVRLRAKEDRVCAQMASSKKPRLLGKAAKGDVGDFWVPVDMEDGKALSVSATGFSYKLLVSLILKRDKYRLPPAMKVASKDGRHRWSLVARSVAGGQGKTEGYHERTDIAFSPKVTSAFSSQEKCKSLETVADSQLEEIGDTEKALRVGVAVIASGGAGEMSKEDYAHAHPFVKKFNNFADAIFFASLEDRFLASDDETTHAHRAKFVRRLIRTACRLLSEAQETIPNMAIYRHRAAAQAERAFWNSLRQSKCVFSDQLDDILSAG